METQDSENEEPPVTQNNLTTDRWKNIEEALSQWCKEGRFKDSEANLFSLSADLGIKRCVLTQYFNQSEYTNFRTWLSEIRYNEAVRMMKAHPTFSNDAISTECGFASHTQIYRIFKQKNRFIAKPMACKVSLFIKRMKRLFSFSNVNKPFKNCCIPMSATPFWVGMQQQP